MNTDTPITEQSRAGCTGAQIDSMPVHIWQDMERIERDRAALIAALVHIENRVTTRELNEGALLREFREKARATLAQVKGG